MKNESTPSIPEIKQKTCDKCGKSTYNHVSISNTIDGNPYQILCMDCYNPDSTPSEGWEAELTKLGEDK